MKEKYDTNEDDDEGFLDMVQQNNVISVCQLTCLFSKDGKKYELDSDEWKKSVGCFFSNYRQADSVMENSTESQNTRRILFCADGRACWHIEDSPSQSVNLSVLYEEKIKELICALGGSNIINLQNEHDLLSNAEEYHMKLSIIASDCMTMLSNACKSFGFLLDKFGCDKWNKKQKDFLFYGAQTPPLQKLIETGHSELMGIYHSECKSNPPNCQSYSMEGEQLKTLLEIGKSWVDGLKSS